MANFNKAKKLHFIYKTTNLINGRYYIGMHSTNNLKDGYLGSGKYLRNAIRKYGEENFQVEILEYLPDRSSLIAREKEIVNETLLKDPHCMNLMRGGIGGFISNEVQLKRSIAGNKKHNFLLISDTEYKTRYSEAVSAGIKKLHKAGVYNYKNLDWTGKTHTPETIEKMKAQHKGTGIGKDNSQYGTCWITNGEQNKKIKKTETIPDGWKRGRKM